MKAKNKHHVLTADQEKQLQNVISKLPNCTRLGLGKTNLLSHHIDVGDAPAIKLQHYAVSPAIEKEMYAELDRMLKLGVIEESQSSWCSPMVK